MKTKLFGLLLAGAVMVCAQHVQAVREVSAAENCIDRACVLTSNISWDTAGYLDTRPTTWGTTDSVRTPFHFTVPVGYRVQILHVRGDLIGWARGPVADGANAGILWGLLRTSSGAASFVDLSADGCYIYHQAVVGKTRERAPFDEDAHDVGLLDSDNVMWSQMALYLNDTGLTIHQEATFLVTFRFVKEQTSGE